MELEKGAIIEEVKYEKSNCKTFSEQQNTPSAHVGRVGGEGQVR